VKDLTSSPARPVPLCATALAAATFLSLIGCQSDNNLAPPVTGGPGTITNTNHDGGAHDAASDRPKATGGSGGTTTTGGGGAKGGSTGTGTGTGGATTSATGGAGGHAGSSAATGGTAGGAAGGAAGGGPPDDPCTACEKKKCSHPSGATSDPDDVYSALAAAIQVCFAGGEFPSNLTGAFCASAGHANNTAATAQAGDAQGTAKTKLCQAFLSCIHRTGCTDEPDVSNVSACYCGEGVSISTCQAPSFVPMGKCVTEFQNAAESDNFATVLGTGSMGSATDTCVASGAAFRIDTFCDSNCCVAECYPDYVAKGGSADPWDPASCNLAAGGTSGGTGGSPGTGGTTGTGGSHTGGTTGTGGIVATGGITGTGGTPATGGTTGTGGTPATGGTTGTGGTPATGGTTGTGGSPSTSNALTNGTFDSSTTGWTAGFGATASRSAQDVAGNPQSGSLDVAITGSAVLITNAAAWQCLSVTAGATETVQASVLIPGQDGSEGLAALWFYGSADCSGANLSAFQTGMSVTNGWQTMKGSIQVPSGALSMAVRLTVYKPLGQTTAEALFDNVSVTKQ
jgi:hypothetical protein